MGSIGRPLGEGRVANRWCLAAIHDIFASNAQRHPEWPCVFETKGPRNSERVFSYKQINETSNQLAHYLVANGCQLGDVVMIYAHRG